VQDLTHATPPRLGPAAVAGRVALIGAVLLAAGGGFAYLRGWLSPSAVTAERIVDEFERAGGRHPGYRRNHAKGVGVSGYFESSGQGVRLSGAAVFRPGRVPVFGRFSLSGGSPHAADTPAAVRGLGLRFSPLGGGEWRTAMINLPVFPVRTPEAFFELMQAADPGRRKAFLARHPEAERAAEVLQRRAISSGFADTTFHSLNAFRLTSGSGESAAVRWELVPERPVVPAGTAVGPTALFDALSADLRRGPLRWHLVVIVGQPGDATDDATTAWPADRERVGVGILTLDRAEGEETSPATDITFDPLVLPPGMAPSDDPLLSARSAVYSRAFTRRAGEAKTPDPVTPTTTGSGK
jgi:catalase